MAFQYPIKCDVMLENRGQCANNAWAYWDNIPKCRLHFSYDLAKAPDLNIKFRIINDLDAPDLKNLLSVREKQITGELVKELEEKQKDSKE